MVEPVHRAAGGIGNAAKPSDEPTVKQTDHAKRGNSHVARSSGKGASASTTVKSGLIDLTPADTYWARKTTPQAFSPRDPIIDLKPADIYYAARTAHTPNTSVSASRTTGAPNANGSTIDDSKPIEEQIDRLKHKLRIPREADARRVVDNKLGSIDDKTIDGRIADLKHALIGKEFPARRQIANRIARLKNLQELRRLTTAAASLRQEADRLMKEIAALKGKVGDQKVPPAVRNRCSSEAKLRSDQLAAINVRLSGPPKAPKGEAALVASSDRMGALSHDFAHPYEFSSDPKHFFVRAEYLRDKLKAMHDEMGRYARLSRQIYGNAKGAEVYFANLRHNWHQALTDLCIAGRMNHVRMNDIDAIHHEIDQLGRNKPEPANSNPMRVARHHPNRK